MEGKDDNGNGFRDHLPSWSGVNIEIVIPDQGRYVAVDTTISNQAIENMIRFGPDATGITPYTYFKVMDDQGKPVTHFEPNLELHVRYTARAWENAANSKLGNGRPQLFYLVKNEEDNWVGEWQVIPRTDEDLDPPEGKPYGKMILYIEDLPDPAIGGC